MRKGIEKEREREDEDGDEDEDEDEDEDVEGEEEEPEGANVPIVKGFLFFPFFYFTLSVGWLFFSSLLFFTSRVSWHWTLEGTTLVTMEGGKKGVKEPQHQQIVRKQEE